MGKRYGRSNKGGGSDKYLRLTGLWPSKSNDDLFTGRVKADDVEKIIERFQEALDAAAPMVFSLWVNNEKESRKDPEFSLQCFVGDAEESPRSRRDSGRDSGSRFKNRSARDEEPEEEPAEEEEEQPEEEEEQDEKPTRKGKAPVKPAGKKKKADW